MDIVLLMGIILQDGHSVYDNHMRVNSKLNMLIIKRDY